MIIVWAILLLGGLFFIVLLVLYNSGYMQKLPVWTGFSFKSYEKVQYADEIQKDEATKHIESRELQPGKTLWDWLQLFVVPVVLAIVVFSFNAGQESMNQNLEQQRRQEQLVDTYLDRMSNLLLMYNLHDAKPKASVRATAQAITLTTLERLDPDHKRIVILFLYRADLIMYHFDYQKEEPKRPDKDKPIITLPYAHLEGVKLNDIYLFRVDLHNMFLSGSDLHGSSLDRADLGNSHAEHVDLSNTSLKAANLYSILLTDANLQNAKLQEANIVGALLSRARLSHADLRRANLGVYTRSTDQHKFFTQLDNAVLDNVNLREAHLNEANLTNADLTQANLSGAKVSSEQLAKVKSLAGATMPDGTRHP